MKLIKAVTHDLGIIWSTTMTILAVEGWALAILLGNMYERAKGAKHGKRETYETENN